MILRSIFGQIKAVSGHFDVDFGHFWDWIVIFGQFNDVSDDSKINLS